MRVREKIAWLLMRVGAKEGRCNGKDRDCDGIDNDSPIRRVSAVHPPAETEEVIQIDRVAK